MLDRNFILNMATQSNDINEYLMTLYNLPVQINAKTIVEIGSGRSSFALVAAANKTEGHVTSIDIGGWDTLNRQENGVEIMKNEKRFTMIEENSLKVNFWNKGMIDFLFLDSEHTYDLTKAEMNSWFGFVRKGGIIAMHDTAHESGQQMECRKALDEFMASSQGGYYHVIHLLDTKIIGLSILIKK